MLILKKLFFALPFLLFLSAFCYQLDTFLQNPNFILSLNPEIAIQTGVLLAYLVFAAFFFVIFSTFSSDLKIAAPVFVLASLTPLLLLNPPSSILSSGFLLSLLLSFFLLEKKLATYLTFQPASLLAPSAKLLISLIILFTSFIFYLGSSAQIQKNGFTLPPSLVDFSLQFVEKQMPQGLEEQQTLPQISPEQIKMLKQNPSLLKQYGLDPTILDQIENPKTIVSSKELIKPMIEQQIQGFIKPYITYLPLILAAVFFLTLQSLASLISILLSPLLWFTFWILEKIGFTQFEVEQREVKKLVI